MDGDALERKATDNAGREVKKKTSGCTAIRPSARPFVRLAGWRTGCRDKRESATRQGRIRRDKSAVTKEQKRTSGIAKERRRTRARYTTLKRLKRCAELPAAREKEKERERRRRRGERQIRRKRKEDEVGGWDGNFSG